MVRLCDEEHRKGRTIKASWVPVPKNRLAFLFKRHSWLLTCSLPKTELLGRGSGHGSGQAYRQPGSTRIQEFPGAVVGSCMHHAAQAFTALALSCCPCLARCQSLLQGSSAIEDTCQVGEGVAELASATHHHHYL